MDIKNPKSINSLIDDVNSEAKMLFNSLDNLSNNIRKLENELNSIKADFSYSIIVSEQISPTKELLERHKKINLYFNPNPVGYFTRFAKYLSWDRYGDEKKTGKYRLQLIDIETEFVFAGFEETYEEVEYESIVINKKPIIETSLSIRLKYSKDLIKFIFSFKEYLNQCRLTIEKGGNPFEKKEK